MGITVKLSMEQLKALRGVAESERGVYQYDHYRASIKNLPEHKSYIETLQRGLDFWEGLIDILNQPEGSEV